MKKLLFGLGFLGLAYASYVYLDNKQTQFTRVDEVAVQENLENVKIFTSVSQSLEKAKSLQDIMAIQYDVSSLSKANRERLQPYITLKKASLLFNEGEFHLKRAEEIEYALSVPEVIQAQPSTTSADPYGTPPPPPPERKYNPLTTLTLKKATSNYEEARNEIDKLSDMDKSPDFNFELNYLKGEIYYRVLEFMSDQETARELFNQTLNYYKLALRHRPNDINTVVNIEILIKNESGLTANSNNPQAQRKQMLNVRKAGLGSSKGN